MHITYCVPFQHFYVLRPKTQLQFKILSKSFSSLPPSQAGEHQSWGEMTGNNKKINSSTSRSAYMPMLKVSNLRLAEDQGKQK
jgi:hypothetical protein